MKSVLELQNLIQGFKLSCQTEGKSPKTIEWYTSFLNRFLHFFKDNDYPTSLSRIDKNSIRAFILYLQQEARTPHSNKTLSHCTVQGYVRTLKAFFSWLLREEYIESNPMSKIPVPKAINKVVNTFSNDQISRLIDVCQRANGLGYRNPSIIMLLLDSGIRVSELIGIGLEDLDLAEGSIRIRRAKGGRERVVPVGSLVQKLLWKYINHYRPEPITGRIIQLFLSEHGISLTKSGIQQMLRRYERQAGINGMRCSPHVFRHTFAKNYLLNGGDIFSLQKILGHSSLASVRIYLNLFACDIKKQHQRFSPVDTFAEDRMLYPMARKAVPSWK
ncbi:tyrosine-type recombinase/integrase [Chloroflexota bacterium]